MANLAVDWTVGKLLSGIQSLNARAESAHNTIRSNRSAYMDTLRALSGVPDLSARAALRAKLTEWIHQQVGVENRYNDFATRYASAKAAVKRFLQTVGVTPPTYLGAAPAIVVPAAVYGGIAIGLAVIATIVALNATQSRSIGSIRDLLETAKLRNWTAAETAQALKALNAANQGTSPDPLGLRSTLEALLPIVAIGAAVFFLAPMMQRKRARA